MGLWLTKDERCRSDDGPHVLDRERGYCAKCGEPMAYTVEEIAKAFDTPAEDLKRYAESVAESMKIYDERCPPDLSNMSMTDDRTIEDCKARYDSHLARQNFAGHRTSKELFIWCAVAPDDSLIAAPFDTEQQVREWAAMSLDEKYRPYRAVKFVADRATDETAAPRLESHFCLHIQRDADGRCIKCGIRPADKS